MKLLLALLISLTLEQALIKRSFRAKHGGDCISDSSCEEGLLCKINRCFTKYESNNLQILGLFEKNICNPKKLCPKNQKCVKHRCVDINTPIVSQVNKTSKIEDVHLIFTGEILLNKKPYLSGIKTDNLINYDHLFTHISKYIKNADLSIVPQQSPFYINPEGKKFIKDVKHTPKELGDAIANAGFKVVLHASTQSYALKEKGIIDTLNFWKTNYPDIYPLGITATLEESEKNNCYIFSKNNITIAIINYSGFEGKSIPTKSKYMVNIINKKKVEDTVQKLKQQVDFIIVCINWGEKSNWTPSKKQIVWAKTLAGLGVNLIIGNYPSYVQPVTYVKHENGNCALVFFSLGVLVGDNASKPEALGALANIVISKDNKKTFISSYNLIPTINHQGQFDQYTVYKLAEYNDELGKKVHKKFSIDKVKNTCERIMGAFAHCG